MPSRSDRQLLLLGLVCGAAFVVGAAGAAPRYNRIVYGALPLALTMACFGGVAYRRRPVARGRFSIGIALSCWPLSVGALAAWIWPSLAGGVRPDEPRSERAHVLFNLARDRFRATLFAELQPVGLSNCRLERFGEQHDGGYLLCGNLLDSVKAGYSYGISGYDQWGCDVARRFGVRVHQYDCFNLSRPVCVEGATEFHAECIASARRTDEGGRLFDTLESQLTRNGDGANHVVVKMDVEGAEWDSLLQATSPVLNRIDQLAVEFHGVGQESQVRAVRRLKEFFHVAHIHYNNYACTELIDPFPAWAYEVLFVSKRLAMAAPSGTGGSHDLDAPNKPARPDCQRPTGRWPSGLAALGFGSAR